MVTSSVMLVGSDADFSSSYFKMASFKMASLKMVAVFEAQVWKSMFENSGSRSCGCSTCVTLCSRRDSAASLSSRRARQVSAAHILDLVDLK